VKLSEYACAEAGTPQALEGTGKVRVLRPMMVGPPNGPGELRVSATRQGARV
jgi:hypothetical protein